MSDKITYIESLVAFIDILGFRELITHVSDEAQGAVIIDGLRSVLLQAKTKLSSKWSWEVDALDVRMFSDCIYISVPAKIENCDAFFQLLELVQSNFVRQRIVVRGAVAIGRHYSDNLLIFSEGLVRAYDIEQRIARFPRILVPGEFWHYVVTHGYDEDIIWFKESYVWNDPEDGKAIIDYLNFMPYDRRNDPNHKGKDLANHKAFILESVSKNASSPEVAGKYKWMARYHDSWCRSMYPQHPELLIDPNPLSHYDTTS